MNRFNLVIAIEGIDGAGKTTLVDLLKKEFGESVCTYSRTKKGSFESKLLNHYPLNKSHILQIPFYLYLSYKNYLKCVRQHQATILIMDRCFLSNFCYFYPFALDNSWLFQFAMLFEIKIFPDEIFIIDEDAGIAQKRDNMRKDIEWLMKTRISYLHAQTARALSKYKITIIPNNFTISDKVEFITNRIDRLRGIKNGS